jgi:probable HAF family extracellular repeat protein
MRVHGGGLHRLGSWLPGPVCDQRQRLGSGGVSDLDGSLYQALIGVSPGQVQIFRGPGPANYTQLTAINDEGVAVGYWRENNDPYRPHAFMYLNNEIIELDSILGSSISLANDNNQGAIVGAADFSANGDELQTHAFLYDPSASKPVTDLGLLAGMTSAGASAVNESNQVVGSMGNDTQSQPFLYNDGGLSAIAEQGFAMDINDDGHIVGAAHAYVSPGVQSGPFLWVEGNLTTIPCDGYPTAINNTDEIVGSAIFTHTNVFATYPFYFDAGQPVPKTLWPGGPEVPEGPPTPSRPPQASDLANLIQHQPGSELVAANDINDSGRISGALLSTEYAADGVVLIPPDKPNQHFGPTIAVVAAIMLFGKGQDGGGLSLVAGRPVPIDPLGPLSQAQKERVLEYSLNIVDQLVTDAAHREQVMKEITTLLEGPSPEG